MRTIVLMVIVGVFGVLAVRLAAQLLEPLTRLP